ncbi:MAG: oligosaccharide flippase family protein, partial [Myxococcota bacterium]|nr:oligosaccharide flippase family protein [Myxococcota bacterium]
MSDPVSAAASTGTLASRASRAALASVLGQAAAQGLRLVGNLVLSYLLFPEAFGLMLIVNTVLLGLQILSDLGLQPAIIRHPRGDDPDFVNTAWTVGVIRGAVLFAIGLALAIPIARFYREP